MLKASEQDRRALFCGSEKIGFYSENSIIIIYTKNAAVFFCNPLHQGKSAYRRSQLFSMAGDFPGRRGGYIVSWMQINPEA